VWTGAASASQLAAFLDDKPDAAVARGDALLARGDGSGAAIAYDQALDHGAPRDHVIAQLASALSLGDPAPCVARLAREAPTMARAHAFVEVALDGLVCATSAPQLAGTPDVVTLETLAREALASPVASEDDHYQLYDALHALRVEAKDSAGAASIAHAYLAYVEHQPAPKSDDERRARDFALLRAATKAGAADRAIAQLEASERALATDPDASQRLGGAYVAAERFDDALAAASRGLARSPQPTQTAHLLSLRATAEAKRGNTDAARRDLDAGIAAAQQINGPQARAGTIALLKQQRDAL
jgi:tetratricopeptide (TPR) repeat protein